jgi:hypothetical protein
MSGNNTVPAEDKSLQLIALPDALANIIGLVDKRQCVYRTHPCWKSITMHLAVPSAWTKNDSDIGKCLL